MNRFSKIFLVFLFVLVGLFLIYPAANAAEECRGGLVPCGRLCDDPTTPEDETRPCTTCDVFALASRVINFVLFTLVPIIAVLFYLIGGLMILLSRGSPGLVATGKNFFWNTTWGLVIIFGSWMIVNTVIKSIAKDKDISDSWFKIVCTSTIQQPPPVQRYACGSLGCVAKSDGEYTEPTCGGKCAAVLQITTGSLPDGTINQNYSQTLQATGGKTPYTFYIVGGDLPSGIGMSDSGVMAGTPTEAGNYAFTVKVEDSTTPTKQLATKQLSIKVNPKVSSLSFITPSLPDAIVGQDYSQTLAVQGGQAPYVFSIIGGSLQGIFNLSSDGKITGKPPAAGSAVFTVKVEDSSGPKLSATREFTIKVVYSGAVSITTASLPDGTVNQNYSQTLQATGGKT
ncbi:MAG: putative Ig domain-containing protein, partial [Patescibacteria group bacterium]